jgi:drug/metabolite transporter (DMT)-like permease
MIGKGEAFAILSALAWAFGVILYKRLGERLPPLALNLRKNTLVLLALVPLLLAFHGFELPALGAAEVAICLASGLLGIGIADTLYFRALNQVGAARMGIVGNFYSPFVIVLAFAFLGERLSGMQLLGFVLVSAGVLVIGAAKGPAVDAAALRRGLAIGVLAVLLMAVAIVMVKRVLEHADLLWVSTIRMLGGVAGMLVIGAFLGGARAPVPLDGRGWLMLVVAAMVGQLLSMLLWLAGYKYTSASVAAILNETASVFIVVLAWIFLGERLTRRKAVGIGCTLGGVALMLVPGGH